MMPHFGCKYAIFLKANHLYFKNILNSILPNILKIALLKKVAYL